jgi:flagellar biosynthetic protein FliR
MEPASEIVRIAPLEVFAFLLTFARVGAMVMLMPAIGEMAVPVRVRLGLALAVSFVMVPLAAPMPIIPDQPFAMATLVGGEVLVGLMIGMTARIVMSALQVAGSTIAMQTGLGFVQAIDPTFGVQGAIIGTFLSLLAVTVIFATGLHVLLFDAIVRSYSVFVPGAAIPLADISALVLETIAASFALGVQLSAPFLVFGLVFNLGAGVLSKLMPQLQIFFVAMPASIILGLALLMLGCGALTMWFVDFFSQRIGGLLG